MKSLVEVMTKLFLVQGIHEMARAKSNRSVDVIKKITNPIELFERLSGYFI